jgi:hypothetical protein
VGITMKPSLTLIILSLSIAACSTTPINYGSADPVPSEHIYDSKYLVQDADQEAVNFVRDKGFTGSACTHTVHIDNNRAFDIRQGQGITIYLEPGNHFFRLDLGAGMCPNESHSESTFIKLGEPQTFRISISSNFNIMLTRIE